LLINRTVHLASISLLRHRIGLGGRIPRKPRLVHDFPILAFEARQPTLGGRTALRTKMRRLPAMNGLLARKPRFIPHFPPFRFQPLPAAAGEIASKRLKPFLVSQWG
jgi:hypothetical protein